MTLAAKMILHILSRPEWEAAIAAGLYRPPSLAAEGFIHCSTPAQLVATANLFYRGRKDLVVLRIDERALRSRLVFEAPARPDDARAESLFPHLYGPLNLDAVLEVIALPAEADGSFQRPPAIPEQRPRRTGWTARAFGRWVAKALGMMK